MYEVSSFRLYLLRAMYLLVVVGLGIVLWPDIIHHSKPWGLMGGTVMCMLAAFSIMCAVGLRYPLQMLPVLLWEIVWKTMWLGIVALPQWLAGHVDQAVQGQVFACAFVVLVYIAVPWRYVWSHYVLKQGDRWTIGSSRAANAGPKTSMKPA